jgi:hypothetical protein
MKGMIPVVSFLAGGLTCLGIWAYTQNKNEVKTMMKSMTDMSDKMMKQIKDAITNK